MEYSRGVTVDQIPQPFVCLLRRLVGRQHIGSELHLYSVAVCYRSGPQFILNLNALHNIVTGICNIVCNLAIEALACNLAHLKNGIYESHSIVIAQLETCCEPLANSIEAEINIAFYSLGLCIDIQIRVILVVELERSHFGQKREDKRTAVIFLACVRYELVFCYWEI